MPTTFLTAEWRKLIMANYTIDPQLLQPLLPYGTELDFFNGECYISLVGFLFKKVRLLGIPVPLHTQFPEVNLRFYVRYKSSEGWRRGVVFIKEIVPRPALSLVAKLFYGEPYQTMPMQWSWKAAADELEVSYSWKHKQWHHLAAIADPVPIPIQEGSEEEFITEHYWGYTRRDSQRTNQYEVVHPRWDVYRIKAFDIAADFGALYGDQFSKLSTQQPQSVLLAEGSEIAVRIGSKISQF